MDRDKPGVRPDTTDAPVYSPVARFFHWLTVLLLAAQIPVGFYMVWRGNATNFDGLTNQLYSGHKLVGFIILWVVVLRLLYRIGAGAPPDEPTLELWQKAASHATHWGLYLMLLVVACLGWVGVSYYGARDVLGGFSLPELVPKNDALAEKVLGWHALAALALIALAGMHVGAALYHYFIRGDGVLRRMLPGVGRRGE